MDRYCQKLKRLKFWRVAILLLLCAAFGTYVFGLPSLLFKPNYATVVESLDGRLLSARIAPDGQWRFPPSDEVPPKFKTCLLRFEDRYFYRHFGFNPWSMARALASNMQSETRRGGSTLTQQVVRLSRGNRRRSYVEKMVELIWATRVEWRYTKDEILAMYTSHAPFGGNVVGLEMASWRYFGRAPEQLSWAESATLAVLPNAPGLIYPGKNQQRLLLKRNRLLQSLHTDGKLDRTTLHLSLSEPLVGKMHSLEHIAPHLLDRFAASTPGKRIRTTVDFDLQTQTKQVLERYLRRYAGGQIHNAAAIIINMENRDVIAYVGNAATQKAHDKDVDIITKGRSTGSLLKPFLFAAMLDEGQLLSSSLVADIPVQIAGFSPQNFDLSFQGAVPADRALVQSLNIPSVLMLQQYGLGKGYGFFKKMRLRHLNRGADHYGLSLILGGAEASLEDMSAAYAAFGGTLQNYLNSKGTYRSSEFSGLNYIQGRRTDFGKVLSESTLVGAGAVYQTLEAMQKLTRPEGDLAWEYYNSSRRIAWKTGTSFGNRDAWAIGLDGKYVVGVWVGNASGEGRAGLTGVGFAAPPMFEIFNALPRTHWFARPYNDLAQTQVCTQSGFRAGPGCPSISQWACVRAHEVAICSFHELVHLDPSGLLANSACEAVENLRPHYWFVLPPVQEYYYKRSVADYIPLPPARPDCTFQSRPPMDFIYPKTHRTKVFATRDAHGHLQPVVLKIAHQSPESKLFWYVNGVFKAQTVHFHEMAFLEAAGVYTITVVDDSGFEVVRKIEVVL